MTHTLIQKQQGAQEFLQKRRTFYYIVCGKSIYFCFIDYAKAFDCVDHNEMNWSRSVMSDSLRPCGL